MKTKLRYDRASVKATFDENGFMIDTPIVARIGVQEYHQPDGSVVREFRPASEVFHADSLASYQGKPITIGHTVVNSKNARDLMVGSCCGVGFREDIAVRVPLTVHADEAIERAKRKESAEISVGYDAEMVDEPGWGSETTGEYILDSMKGDSDHIPADWVRFDAVQTRIRVNHVALVFRGRAGIAKLNLDSNQEFPYDDPELNKIGGKEVKKIKLDGAIEIEVDAKVADHIDSLTARADAADGKVTTLKAERDALQVKVDGFDQLLKDAAEAGRAEAKARSALEATLTANGVEVKADATDSDLKIAFIKAVNGVDATGKSDAYIDASFDIAVEGADNISQSRKQMHGDQGQRNDKADDDLIPDPQIQLEKLR